MKNSEPTIALRDFKSAKANDNALIMPLYLLPTQELALRRLLAWVETEYELIGDLKPCLSKETDSNKIKRQEIKQKISILVNEYNELSCLPKAIRCAFFDLKQALNDSVFYKNDFNENHSRDDIQALKLLLQWLINNPSPTRTPLLFINRAIETLSQAIDEHFEHNL